MTTGKKSFARNCLDSPSNQVFIRYTSCVEGFPGGSVVKNPSANARDGGLITGSGIFPGGGNGNPLQYSCWENPMDRGAWRAAFHEVTKNWTWLSAHSLTVTVLAKQYKVYITRFWKHSEFAISAKPGHPTVQEHVIFRIKHVSHKVLIEMSLLALLLKMNFKI